MNRKSVLFIAGMMATAQASPLYVDQMNNGASWGLNANGSDYTATFNYDYSANGIPEAPNSQGGDVATRGLSMRANISSGTSQSLTLYPMGKSFNGSYQLRFDAYMSFSSINGSTEFLGGGVGYNNTDTDLTSGAQAIATGDGGSSSDWRAFNNGAYSSLGNGNSEPYVSFLPSINGSTSGSPGFQWVTWEFNTHAGDVTIVIEKPDSSRLELTSFTSASSTDGNISLYYGDIFTSIASPTEDAFGLIDNVVVTSIPEPASLGLLGLVSGGIYFARRFFIA